MLESHLETFVLACRAGGLTYVDHDAAFKRAIRDNWAQLNASNSRGDGHRPVHSAMSVATSTPAARPSGPTPSTDDWPLPPGVTLEQEQFASDLWGKALVLVKQKLGDPTSFSRFAGTRGMGVDVESNRIGIRVPCTESLVIRDKYDTMIEEIFKELAPPRGFTVLYITPREVSNAA